MFVTGGAGTGKSFLIVMLREMLVRASTGPLANNVVALLAPTGVAAANIKGSTLHSRFKLIVEDIRAGRMAGRGAYRALTGKQLQDLQRSVIGLRYLIIDEISMVSAETLEEVGGGLWAPGVSNAVCGLSVRPLPHLHGRARPSFNCTCLRCTLGRPAQASYALAGYT
jgi:hypothetical protein